MPESACEIIWFSGWIEGLNDVVKLKVDAKPGMIKNAWLIRIFWKSTSNVKGGFSYNGWLRFLINLATLN